MFFYWGNFIGVFRHKNGVVEMSIMDIVIGQLEDLAVRAKYDSREAIISKIDIIIDEAKILKENLDTYIDALKKVANRVG